MLDFSRIDIALGIDSDIVYPMKLAGGSSAAPEMAYDAQIVSSEYPNALVCTVGHVQIGFIRIGGNINVPYGAGGYRVLGYKALFTNVPSLRKTWSRLLLRSATYTRPSLVI